MTAANPNTVLQYSFATGCVAPGVRNRKDWNRLDAAFAEGVNGIVTPTGGFRKRPGLRFIDTCLHHDRAVTLARFVFSTTQVYLLEFGEYQMRFFANGGLVLTDEDEPLVLDTPFSAAQAAEMSYAQERDAVFFAHWDKPLKKLVRYGHNKWRWSDVFTDEELERIESPDVVDWFDDSGDGHNGFEYGVTAYQMEEGTPKESVGFSSILADPASIDIIPEVPIAHINSCLAWVEKYRLTHGHIENFPTIPVEFDLRSVTHDQMTPLAPRLSGSSGGLNARLFEFYQLLYPTAVSAGFGYTTQGGMITLRDWKYYLANAAGNTVFSLGYLVTNTSNNTSGVNSSLYSQWRAYVSSYNNTAVMLQNAYNIINGNRITIDGKTGGSIYQEIIDFVDLYNLRQSGKTSNHIRWSTVPEAHGYYVYRRHQDSEDRNFYLIADLGAGETDFLDEDVYETVPTFKTPIEGENNFTMPDDYPALATFYQQRLVLGCTKNRPTTIFGSRTGIYTDFTINATDPSSAYEFKMASKESNPLQAILPLYTLAILTEGGDFISTVSGAMNASNVNFNQKSYNGCSHVPPVIIGDSGMYVPLNQQTIKAMTYAYEKDGFKHDNILFHAQHFTRNKKVVGLAYQRDPINLIWAVLDDGTLLSCLYIPDQGFMAWSEHHTQGRVRSIITVPGDGYDDLYMVVERTLGDGTVRQHIEMLEDVRPYGREPDAESAFFVDAGLSGVFDDPVEYVTGLEHLEGLTVSVLADFRVLEPRRVTGGRIDLDHAASVVHVGLPYEYRLKTLNFERTDATLRNTRRQISQCFVEVEDCRELYYSANDGEALELALHDGDSLGEPRLLEGDFPLFMTAAHAKGTYLTFTSSSPVPCTVVSVVAEIDDGDS